MRRWIVKTTTGASVLFVIVGLAGWVWIRARPETLSDTLKPIKSCAAVSALGLIPDIGNDNRFVRH